MRQQPFEIGTQACNIQRQIVFEWCDRESDHTSEFTAQFQGIHLVHDRATVSAKCSAYVDLALRFTNPRATWPSWLRRSAGNSETNGGIVPVTAMPASS